MSNIELKEIFAVQIGNEFLHYDCLTSDEKTELKEDDILKVGDEEQGLYFCDRCEKSLP